MTDGPSWELPAALDEYRVLKPLGHGSMGQVYLARDTLLDRLVAVKLVAGGSPGDTQRERFRVEARAIARVQHPNIVEIYRAGEANGRPYLVSEYVRGQSLDQLPLPLPWDRVLPIAIDLSRGLAAAHRRGVLHRDIKPANAMLTEDGTVKLLDFGVAKLVDAAGGAAAILLAPPRPTGSASVAETVDARPVGFSSRSEFPGPKQAHPTGLIGTPRYMAPEIWRLEPATPGSDLYSLGVVLHELCCGDAPHAASTLEALRVAVLEQDAVALAQRVPEVNPDFAKLVDRCLARDPAQRFASADALREALEALRGGREEAGASERPPYPGLTAFGAEDRGTFFGRDAQVRAVLERLRGESLVLVAGDSGAGKSSLCRAGVLPRVADGALGPGGAWAACEMLPGRHPLQALAVALAPFGGGEADLLRLLEQSPLEIGRWALARAPDRKLVVLVDQLEEILTLTAPEELDSFTGAVRSLSSSGPRLRVLATIRGDFLARLAALPGLGDHLSSGLYLLPPLSEAGLREAITAPSHGQGYAFESAALIESLIAAGGAEGGLPLLQFALAELWERRDRGRRVIPAEALVALGGVEGALARHADGVLAQMRPGQRAAARRLLLRLVLAEGTRARRARAELLGEAAAEHAQALEALVRGRLVLAREAPDGTATYELAHEALLRGWDTLRGWQANDQEQRALHQRLERACAEWERLGRPREQLWGRRQLAESRGLDERELSAVEVAFVRASRRASRRRTLSVIAALLITPLSAGGVYGWLELRAWQAREREVAQALADAGRAVALAESRDQRAKVLRQAAFESFDARNNDEAERIWSQARQAGAEEAAAYDEAVLALDRGLARHGSRPELRHLLAEVLYRYILAAERDHHEPERALLQRRLEVTDDTREYQERLNEPAHIQIESEPGGAEVWIQRAEGVGDGSRPGKKRWAPLPGPARTTPLSDVTLPPGSYRLRFERPGRPPVLYPVLLGRGTRAALRVPLPAAVPDRYAYVAPGDFLYGSTDEEDARVTLVQAPPLHQRRTEGFLIARHEVTYGEWIEFLRTLTPAERARRRPHGENYFGVIRLDEIPDGRWELVMSHGQHTYRAREGARFVYLQRDHRADQDWLQFPVSSISWEDAQAYLDWMNRTGRLRGARFCTEIEWERAARGADGRQYPHGDWLEPEDVDFDLTYGQKSLAYGPDEVGSHPASDSPFEVADMSGNVWEWSTTGPPNDLAAYGGGSFYQDRATARSMNHAAADPALRWPFLGLRVCAPAPPP